MHLLLKVSVVLTVEIAYAIENDQAVGVERVSFEPGMTVKDVIDRSDLRSFDDPMRWSSVGLSLYGRRVALTTNVQPDDRIEVCKPLRVDPKKARVLRHQRQLRARDNPSKGH